MALTLPELDDRRYEDLVEEARSLMVTLAPQLTNHNPSDPVVTLAELFAYFTDALLFRLNCITDANRQAFLRLLNGPEWKAPASRADLDAEMHRSVLRLREVERAVTPADYELLALAADQRIKRAHCVPGFNLALDDPRARGLESPGHVSVIVVPTPGSSLDVLRQRVADHIEPRRLLATRVVVVGHREVPVRVRLTVQLLPDSVESEMEERIWGALARYLDPFIGRDGRGWPFGRSVNVSEIYRLLDTLPGVDFATRSRHPTTQAPLDELLVPAEYADRLVRNEADELVRVTLLPDELVKPNIFAADIDIRPAVDVA
jgi:hypothetical protein